MTETKNSEHKKTEQDKQPKANKVLPTGEILK